MVVLGCRGISWTICKQSAPHSRQITTPTPHHSIFYRLDALPDAQTTVSKHRRQQIVQAHNHIIISKIALISFFQKLLQNLLQQPLLLQGYPLLPSIATSGWHKEWICPQYKGCEVHAPNLVHPVWGSGPQYTHVTDRAWMAALANSSLHPKRHLDRFMRFCKVHGCAQTRRYNTDRATTRRLYLQAASSTACSAGDVAFM